MQVRGLLLGGMGLATAVVLSAQGVVAAPAGAAAPMKGSVVSAPFPAPGPEPRCRCMCP